MSSHSARQYTSLQRRFEGRCGLRNYGQYGAIRRHVRKPQNSILLTSYQILVFMSIKSPPLCVPLSRDRRIYPQAPSAVSSLVICCWVSCLLQHSGDITVLHFISYFFRCYTVVVMFKMLQHHIVCFCLPCQCVSTAYVSRPTEF